MIGAMLVLLGVIAAFVVFRDVNRNDPASPVPTVDYQKTLRYAQADFRLLAPARLPAGWRATSVDFVPDPTRWHLGLLTDQQGYVGLEQSHSPVREMVTSYVDRNAAAGQPVRIDGASWRSWTDQGGDTALTRVEGGVTTLVVGTPGRDVLVRFVKTLR